MEEVFPDGLDPYATEDDYRDILEAYGASGEPSDPDAILDKITQFLKADNTVERAFHDPGSEKIEFTLDTGRKYVLQLVVDRY